MRRIATILLFAAVAAAQQSLPDAPAPKSPLSNAPTSTLPDRAPLPAEAGVQPANDAPPPPNNPVPTNQPASLPGRTADTSKLEQTFRLNVNLKILPITVKDSSGKIIQDLQENDFAVYENGVRQQIRYFSSDAFPLSAAIIVDTGLPNSTLERVKSTLSSLNGAFGPYDEIAVFSYGGSVTLQSDFGPAGNAHFTAGLEQIAKVRGQENAGVPVTSGPFSPGIKVNNHPIDPNTSGSGSMINAPPTNARVSRVMNDALFIAAQALAKRERTRRKIILIISDGQEFNSKNSYSDVLKVILNDEIIVDAIALDAASLPVLNKLEQIHLPRQGYSNLLPRYASATGGTVYRELSRTAIENAYAQATFDARNQYTIGYSPQTANISGEYRQLDVRVHRPGLKVYAPDGYYSLPPRL